MALLPHPSPSSSPPSPLGSPAHHHHHLALPPPKHYESFSQLSCKDSHEDRQDLDKKELWSFHDTSVLLDLYEEIFLAFGRGMVRKKDWKRISEQLTQQSGFAKSAEQCKNRIEYLRKYYRKEKVKYVGTSTDSPWVFYKKLEGLVEDSSNKCLDGFKQSAIPCIDGGPRQSDAHGNSVHTFSRPEDESVSPAHQNSHPVDTLDEEETVATTKGQVASTPETSSKPCKKRRKLVASLGKDLKEGLSEFAAVMERIERTKMELVLTLERQRAEQEQKRAEMEMERTRMLLQNQLEVARLFCENRPHGRGGENGNG
eukprot:c22801_g1_i1 orf=263-1204(-)